MSSEANPEMLVLAREIRGLSQRELAQLTNIHQASVSRYERKLVSIPQDELEVFAKALKFPMEFFYRKAMLYDSEISEVFHRKRRSLSVANLRRTDAILNLFRLNVEVLLEAVDAEPAYSIPDCNIKVSNLSAGEIAGLVRTVWNLPSGPISNLTQVLEDAYVLIFAYDFGTDEIDEITQWIEPLPPIMLVNNRAPGDRLRFNIAHALGHLVMHHDLTPYEEMEKEADQFAAAFLMPQEAIKPELAPVTLERMIQLKPKWKVSVQALIRRALDIGEIDEKRYKSLYERISRAGYRKKEPFPLSVERPTLFTKLLRFYQTELHYSIEEIAQLLWIHERDLENLYSAELPPLRLVPKKNPDNKGDYKTIG